MNILNALSYGGITAIIGIAIVFVGLTILIVAVSIMASIFKKIDKKKADKARAAHEAAARAAAAEAAKAAKAAPAPAPVEETVEEDDPALIAVIAAALAAYTDANKPLVVRKVRRVSGWNAAARREQLERF
ncbi:MAG: sodium pump decarboxylase subunit gamma [Clostridiales bacterium]|nr:sodium pump decarboxylase subunit gamma [Clostridiales bacterium]